MGSFILVSEIVQCPLVNLMRHPALSNCETERRDMFDEGTNIALFSVMQLTAPLHPGDFVQTVAVPRPEDETDPLISFLLGKLGGRGSPGVQ